MKEIINHTFRNVGLTAERAFVDIISMRVTKVVTHSEFWDINFTVGIYFSQTAKEPLEIKTFSISKRKDEETDVIAVCWKHIEHTFTYVETV